MWVSQLLNMEQSDIREGQQTTHKKKRVYLNIQHVVFGARGSSSHGRRSQKDMQQSGANTFFVYCKVQVSFTLLHYLLYSVSLLEQCAAWSQFSFML